MGIPSYGVDYESQYDFLQIGTITSAQAALAVTARDNASVVALAAAKKVIWSPDQGTAAAILRFRTDGAEDDAPVIQVYAAKGADYYTRIATLTLAQGTQDWSGGHFVDEITLSNEAWAHGIRANSVTDEVGRVVFNTGGFDRFLFIASTLTVTTVHIDIARLDKQIDHGIEIHSAILVLADNMTVSDVVSAISDMHSDLTAQNDSIIDQVTSATVLQNSIADELDSTVILLNSVADEADSAVVLLNSVVDELDSINDAVSEILSVQRSILDDTSVIHSILKETLDFSDANSAYNVVEELSGTHSAILTLADGMDVSDIVSNLSALRSETESALGSILNDTSAAVDELSSIITGVETANTNLVAVKSALSDLLEASLDSIETDIEGLSAQNSSVITELEGLSAQNSSVITELEGISAQNSSLITAIETGDAGLSAQLSSLLTDVEATKDNTDSTVNRLDSIAGLQNSIADNTRSVAIDTETIADNTDSAVNVLDSIVHDTSIFHSIFLRTQVSAGTPSVLLLSDIASATDATRTAVTGIRSGNLSAATLLETTLEAIDSDIVALESAQSGMFNTLENDVELLKSAVLAMDSAISGWFVEHEAGLRSGFESALSAIDESDSVHSALSGIVIDAVEVVATEIRTLESSLSDAFVTLESTLDNLVAVPIEKTPVLVTQFVAVSGTAEALIGSETFVRAIYLQARKVAGDNTGNIFIGLSDLDQGVAELFEVIPGGTYELVMPAGCKVDLNDIYVDADNADDGVVGYYIPV